MSARVPLTFRLFRGDALLREETLSQPVIKIGKVGSAHLCIDDASVSRMHAILEVGATGGVTLIDLGSTRGTLVNGQKIHKATLESGDSIQLGDIRIELAIGEPVRASAVRPPAVPMPAVRPPAVPMPAVPSPDVRPAATPVMFAGHDPAETDDVGGARAIEVAAMLGDSVVGVKHCIDPKSGKISRKTWAVLAAGVVCAVASAVSFGMSVSTAAFNKGGLDYWVNVLHKPAYAFRPETLGAGYDWFAFGGFALGLIATALGIARVRDEKKSPYYRIGTAPGVELPLDTAPAPSFPLVAPSGDDFVFNYGAGIDGELIVDGKATPLSQLAATGRARPSLATAGAIEVPIPLRAKIRARSGQTTFVVSAVPRPRRHVSPLLAGLESRTLSYFAGSLAVHMGIWALLQQIPPDGGSATIDVAMQTDVDIRTQTTENETAPPPEQDSDGQSGGTEGQGAKMDLPEGAAGTTKSDRPDGHIRIKDNHVDPQVARTQAIEAARTAGILGSAPAMGAAFASLSSTSEISSGIDATDVYGPLYGADGEGKGAFGYGRSGFMPGGGCGQPPCGIIGTGRYGTYGTGNHAGDGYNGPGGGGPGFHRHAGLTPTTTIGQPEPHGDLDKAIIRRYIKQNYAKFSYCYEHELIARPGLAGDVLAQFVIAGNGTVQASAAGGFDPTVANCVAGVIKNIEFPRPSNGGSVQVNYPFSFHAAGQQ